MDPKYKNGKIYNITSNNTNMLYIGSCITTLKYRLCSHKSKNNCSSKHIIECGDYNINLIEEYSCNNNDELRIREQYWIDKYRREGKNVINERDAYRSEEQLIEYHKEYEKCRKPRIEYYKKYRENNRKKHNEYYKKYHENNRKKRNEYDREYKFMNRKKICNACYDFLEMLKHY
jgi:hypothetical protein